ncbi:MAG: phosphoglucosamine mutase [Acidobacteriia bacterium]|nr:phosphoglucosamine mutase [Terriglobia bacterium]
MSNKPKFFGTDGIRGVAGSFPLDRAMVGKIGRALGRVLRATSGTPRVLLGQDTRESGEWISRTLATGLRAEGAEVTYAGVITTPGVAFLTRHHAFAAGVVVSASHNPYEDNGIKVLARTGMKFSEDAEVEIERALEQVDAGGVAIPEAPLEIKPGLLEDYLEFLASLVPSGKSFHGYRLVVDCAHGAASRAAPALFARLGIEARILHAEPTGRNINLQCGSLYPETMQATTQSLGADLGVAFDGDADRAIFATRPGRLVDGDHVLFGVAPFLAQRGLLKGGAVVGTLMTNLALELAFARHGLALKRTAVGDKYVLEEMLRSSINLGGEPSGHLIFADVSLAGDGFITLLHVLWLLSETGQSLDAVVSGYRPFPQIIRNVRVRAKKVLEGVPEIAQAIEECRGALGARGRVVVRYSGTEPLARVMVEAEDAATVEFHAAQIAGAIDAALGLR